MKHIALITLSALMLSACSTVKMPDFDLKKLAAFKGEKIDGDYPEVSEAPSAPTNVPSAAEWDASAKRMLAARDSLAAPDGEATAKTPAEIQAEFDRLRAKVHAYKADDPQ